MVCLNSTFAEVSLLDKVALYWPHVVYSTGVKPEIVSYSMMIATATIVVIVGSYAGVSQPQSARDPLADRESALWDPTDRDGSALYILLVDSALNLNMELMDKKTVLLLPVGSAAALYGLDYLLRLFDVSKTYLLHLYVINMVFHAGCMVLSYLLSAVLRNVGYVLGLKNNLGYFLSRYYISLSTEESLPLGLIDKWETNANVDLHEVEQFMKERNNATVIKARDVDAKSQHSSLVLDMKYFVVAPFAVGLMALYYFYNPAFRSSYDFKKINWIVNNITAVVLALAGCMVTRIGSFKVGVIMLAGLFCYDVYFVFKSTLMISVASNLELPIKLVFPGAPATVLRYSEMSSQTVRSLLTGSSMLGLGDIVVPTAFTSLCLRFDNHVHYKRTQEAFHRLRWIKTPYFAAAIASYVAALIATVGANHLSGHGQPALLYIVPSMLVSVFGVGACNGEVGLLWQYSEELEAYPQECAREEESHQRPTMQIYEFDETDDESDDTYVIVDDTDDDEDYDSEDLSNEVSFLIRDQA